MINPISQSGNLDLGKTSVTKLTRPDVSEYDRQQINRALKVAPYILKVNSIQHDVCHQLFGKSALTEPNNHLKLSSEDYKRLLNAIAHKTKQDGYQAGLSIDIQLYYISHILSPGIATTDTMKFYIEKYFDSTRTENFIIEQFSERCSPFGHLLKYIVREHPIMAAVTADLYHTISDPCSNFNSQCDKADLPRPVRGWYLDVIQNTTQAWHSLEHVFLKLESKCFCDERYLKFFLQDWKEDLRKSLVEIVNMANVHAINIYARIGGQLPPQSLLYWPYFPKPYGRSHDQIKADLKLLQDSRLEERFDYLFNNKAIRESKISVPIWHSTADLLDYSQYLNEYFSDLCVAINKKGVKVVGKAEQILLDQDFVIRCYPNEIYGKHQARISISSRKEKFSDFVLRVDRESKDTLAFDFGNITYNEAIELGIKVIAGMQELYKKEIHYCEVVDENGCFIENQLHKNMSLMKVDANVPLGHRATLMAVILSHAGSMMGTRFGDVVGHHISENIGKRTAVQEFERIVNGFRDLLLR
jgi:hypothetical protein